MLKYYKVAYMTFDKNEEIVSYSGITIQEEGAVQNKTFYLNWNNIEEIQKQYGVYLGFSIRKKKKGRVISFFGWTNDIKEWRTKELNLIFEILYMEVTPSSIAEILKYSDGEKAIRYLNQLGLKLNLTETEKHGII